MLLALHLDILAAWIHWGSQRCRSFAGEQTHANTEKCILEEENQDGGDGGDDDGDDDDDGVDVFSIVYFFLAITKELLKNTKTCVIPANLAGGRKSGLARTAMQPEDYEKDEMVYHCISAFDPHSLSTARIRHHAVAIF